jgi:hypothetical protein
MTARVRWKAAVESILLVTLLSFLNAPAAEPVPSSSVQSLAEQGDANAQWMMGQSFLNRGVAPEDVAQALMWFRRAADQGHALAQRDVGMLYELGRGVKQDLQEAFFWYSLASQQDSGRARLRRDVLASRLAPSERDAVLERVRAWRPTR